MKGILLAITLVLASVGIQAKELPSNDEIIANLSKEGYSADWEEMESGGKKLKVDGGSFYVNDKGAFALVAMGGESEDELYLSFLIQMDVCTDIGVAAIGNNSTRMREMIIDTLVSSTQVVGTTVSDMVWGYDYEAKMLPIGTGAIWSCGIYR